MDTAMQIIDDNVDLSIQFFSDGISGGTTPPTDSVYSYACEVLSLGLFYLEFQDAIKHGDGDCDMIVWKYLLLLFKASKRTNYALTYLAQYYLIFPPRLTEQLNGQFVNMHGLPGRNVSCDLPMEHLNREVKTAIKGLGANKSLLRTGKAVGVLTDKFTNFDKDNSISMDCGTHAVRSAKKDLAKIQKQLTSSQVFTLVPDRQHKSFKNLKTNMIRTLMKQELTDWILDHYYPIQFESNFTV